MFKAVILLSRGKHQSPDDFRRWWLEEHAPLARQLPGLKRLVFNLASPSMNPETSAPDMVGLPYDGVSELWFESKEAFLAAYDTEIGRQVSSDSLAHVSGRLRLFVEEHIQVA